MDLKNGHNLIRRAVGDEWKTAFYTKQGLCKYTLIPFGLTNAYASFQEMMDMIFKDMEEYIWYFDDIFICGGNTEVEHQAIVEKVGQ